MRPISDINIGDIYARSYPYTLEYVVELIDGKEKMIRVKDTSFTRKTFWKKNTDSLFNRRVLNGKTMEIE